MKHKFTLIELLVVVAVIGTLVSLLLPAIGSARKKLNQLFVKIILNRFISQVLITL